MLVESLLLGGLVLGARAQSTTTSENSAATTLSLFGDFEGEQAFIGSIVDVDCDTTRIALACTSGTTGELPFSQSCDPEITNTYTYIGSTSFAFTVETSSDGFSLSAAEACDMADSTSVVCTGTLAAAVEVPGGNDPTSTSSEFTTTLTEPNMFQVPITAGAEKLEATCTEDEGAAPRALPTGVVGGVAEVVVKVLIVPVGAAALAAAGW